MMMVLFGMDGESRGGGGRESRRRIWVVTVD
jgi:hypothetical protein